MSKVFERSRAAGGRTHTGFREAGLHRATSPYAVSEPRMEPVDDTGVALMVFLCAGALLIGWALLIASLLYVVASFSTTAWLLTSLGLAAGHAALAAVCWRTANPGPRI